MNPLGMVEALIGAMQHAAHLQGGNEEIEYWTKGLRMHIHRAMAGGKGTRDLSGPEGLTTEQFIDHIARKLSGEESEPETVGSKIETFGRSSQVDLDLIQSMFDDLDIDGNGSIDFDEFTQGIARLGIQPKKFGFK